MGIVREHINLKEAKKHLIQEIDNKLNIKESFNFERGLDPKTAMNIGHAHWKDLKYGDLLKSKIDFSVSYDNNIDAKYNRNSNKKFAKDSIFFLEKAHFYHDGGIGIEFQYNEDTSNRYLWGYPFEFSKIFDKI